MRTDSVKAPFSNRTLAGSIGRNTVFGIIASVVQVATRLVTVPIVIAHLGLGGYGIWSIILVTSTYMRFGSIGIKSAFQKYVAEATGNGNYQAASKLLSTGTAVMLGLSICGLIPAAIFSEQIAKASGVPPEFLHSSAQAISILALIMVLSNTGAAYEAIVLGGHRIDLTRQFSTFVCVAEAVGIVAAMHFGGGLFALALVICASEIAYVFCCYLASHRVVPELRMSRRQIARDTLPELIRFGGSYQLVNILQMIYGAIAPIAILKAYGANSAGVYAVATRLVSPVMMAHSAFIVPILSSSAMVYASGSLERMRRLVEKSFKITLFLTLLPLALVSAFGTYLILAWTGQTGPLFRGSLWLVSLATLFQAFSLLGLVLYRASGRALMDNIREIIRILILLLVVLGAPWLGFYGILAGIATAELVGMIFMLFALTKTYSAFQLKSLLPEFLRLAMATLGVVAVGAIAAKISFPSVSSLRTLATLKAGTICLATTLSVYPALYLTGALTKSEMDSLLAVFRKRPSTPIETGE